MREAAITLPLDVVEQLIALAEDAFLPESLEPIRLAKREVAQVKEMLDGSAPTED